MDNYLKTWWILIWFRPDKVAAHVRGNEKSENPTKFFLETLTLCAGVLAAKFALFEVPSTEASLLDITRQAVLVFVGTVLGWIAASYWLHGMLRRFGSNNAWRFTRGACAYSSALWWGLLSLFLLFDWVEAPPPLRLPIPPYHTSPYHFEDLTWVPARSSVLLTLPVSAWVLVVLVCLLNSVHKIGLWRTVVATVLASTVSSGFGLATMRLFVAPSLDPILRLRMEEQMDQASEYVEIGAAVVMAIGVLGIVYDAIRGRNVFQQRAFQLLAFLLVVPTVLILGLEQKLDGSVTATLLGVVIGYVLAGAPGGAESISAGVPRQNQR
jgi:hypothetical protein